MCATLTKPMLQSSGGNVYVRADSPAALTPAPALITWAPSSGEGCMTRAASLDDFRKAAPSFEAGARLLDETARTVFHGPDAGRFELRQPIPPAAGSPALPADIQKLLGWSAEDVRTVGAFPARR
jgi:hypothetical protein